MWHSVNNVKSTEDSITADISIKGDSQWFDGHFPGLPVLPGIAQISMIQDAVQQMDGHNGNRVTITGITKMRFRQLITGEAILNLTMTKEKKSPSHYKFKLLHNNQLICNGTVLLGSIK